jgi:beta-glucosidase
LIAQRRDAALRGAGEVPARACAVPPDEARRQGRNPARDAPSEWRPAARETIIAKSVEQEASLAERIAELVGRMTLDEKIGQMSQADAGGPVITDGLREAVCAGRVGAVLNQVDPGTVAELQRIAREESRLGIPLLVGRDVIHGFTTVMPIPLGLAATWNPEVVRAGARVAALEAAETGVNWTFAPMIDVSRDPRWGRIAESFGEDPWLTGRMGVAMIQGFQGENPADPGSIAACAKHFAGYGAAESGRDYATTSIPENELRNVHLRPFHAAVNAGVCTVMASFSDLNGVPATANEFLMRQVLRDEWDFRGFVVSDWDSVRQLAVHGLTEGDRDSAYAAASAGVDMEMAGDAYRNHLADLVRDGRLGMDAVDAAVANVLRVKFRLGLFEQPRATAGAADAMDADARREVARQAALQSVVMLKNDRQVLPLQRAGLRSLAVIGPLADDGYEQMGTWVFDGDPALSVTPLAGIRALAGDGVEIRHVRALETTRSRSEDGFAAALEAAAASDAVLLFLGEEAILSGEAHSRADIGLPGAQAALVHRLRQAGRPVILVVMAGRPLTLSEVADEVDALLFAWHPGSMGGVAIAELLFGDESPSGKLPVTFPRMVGQVPIYYAQKNTGKPPSPDTIVHLDEIAPRAPQTSFGMTAFHLDAGYTPLYPFGHGLSYARFEYEALRLDAPSVRLGDSLRVSVKVTNRSGIPADEVVQLYVRDLVASVTRPVRELKGFRRVRIGAGCTVEVTFELPTSALAFFDRNNRPVTEPGEFHLWVGGSSLAELRAEFRVLDAA